MSLNPEQREAVAAGPGVWRVEAGAGAGKTRVLVERYRRLVLDEGAAENEVLCLTFTRSAADEMRQRAGAVRNGRGGFRTFHSLALALVSAERDALPFRLDDDPIPQNGQPVRLLRKILRVHRSVSFREARNFISLKKRAGLTPQQVIAQSYDARDALLAQIYLAYDKQMQAEGWLDFESMQMEAERLLVTSAEVRARWQFPWVQIDEAQDCEPIQWRIAKLVSERYGNVFCVGDVNQCQPPDTKVLVLESPARGRWPAKFREVEIQDLRDGDSVLSWTKCDQRMYHVPRRIRISMRWHDGKLLRIKAGGKETRVTPDHFVWTRFSPAAFTGSNHYVYLMWKPGLGYRIGRSFLRRRCGLNQLSHRGLQEKASKFWILCITGSRQEAEVIEKIYSLRYGIPDSVFNHSATKARTPEQIARIFAAANPDGGRKALEDHGLLEEAPLLSWPSGSLQKLHGYFRTAAANLLPGIMEIPLPQTNKSAITESVTREDYSGRVYSLDVEKDHTYIADGIVVGNCIYEWRGAGPQQFLDLAQLFPGVRTLYLPVNYRSTQTIVDFCKEIAPVKTGLVERLRAAQGQGQPPDVCGFSTDTEEADALIARIERPEAAAVLVRTNRQLRALEDACLVRGMKYTLLGRSGFWQRQEVQDVLAFLRFLDRPTDDEALRRIVRSPYPCSKYLGSAFLKTLPLPLVYSLARPPAGAEAYQMDAARRLSRTLSDLREATKDVTVPRTVEEIIARSGMEQYFRADDDDEGDADNWAMENLAELVQVAARFRSIEDILAHANRALRAAASKSQQGVTLSTIHQAKGREWESVYVAGVTDEILPHKNGEYEEEQRIFYVACSRAAQRLVIAFHGKASVFVPGPEGDLTRSETAAIPKSLAAAEAGLSGKLKSRPVPFGEMAKALDLF